MKRIQTLLAEALAGKSPYARPSEAALAWVAARCGPAEIAEILALFLDMSAERDALPAWDGDSADDIAFFEQTLRGVLERVPPRLIPEIARGLGSADARVRTNTATALAGHGRPVEAMLRAYLADETDATARTIVTMVLDELTAR